MPKRLPTELQGYHRKVDEHLEHFRKAHGEAAQSLTRAYEEHEAQLERDRASRAVADVAESLQEPA